MKLLNKIAMAFHYGGMPFVNQNVDQEIHKAVFSAQEELLKEAQAVLDNVKSDAELGKPQYPQEEEVLLKKLRNLGFSNQPQVKELQAKMDAYKIRLEEYKKEQDKAKSTAQLIEYYQKKYNHKFITIDSIKSICNRFGLLFAPIEMYSAEIPLKNMREIADFKCDVEDKLTRARAEISSSKFVNLVRNKERRRGFDYKVTIEVMIDASKEKSYEWRYPANRIVNAVFEKYGVEIDTYDVHDVILSPQAGNTLSNGMMIAPKNKFIIPENYSVENGFEVGYKKIVEIKDPVVLQPVIGGYLIVSAWGFEETLPEISGIPSSDISDNMN